MNHRNIANSGIAQLTTEAKEILIGVETDDLLGGAFPRKRVVHPGVMGERVAPALQAKRWEEIMAGSGPSGKRTAYIHIPFCQARCLYCGFFQNFSDDTAETLYVTTLIAELARNARTRFGTTYPVHAVYFGGGTPSALSAVNIGRLLRAMRQYLPLANDCEITFEARIHGFDDEKIAACIENGVNRFSFGVQSFDNQVRQSVGRFDDRDTVLKRLGYLRDLDQASVVVDLIYGLPYQTDDVWCADLESYFQAGIDGVDLYKLNVYENSMLKKAIAGGALPAGADLAGQGRMFAGGVAQMQNRRCRRLSICHWARTGRERNLYNSLNKGGATVLPFGAGAGGNLAGTTLMLERDMTRYLERVNSGEKPIMSMTESHPDHRLHSRVVAQIEAGYINLRQLASDFGVDVGSATEICEIWGRRGLLEKRLCDYQLTIPGQFWYVNISQSVLELLATRQGEPIRSVVAL